MIANMMKRYIISLMLLLCPTVCLLAANEDEVAARLSAMGFENVRVAEQGDQVVYVAFEAVSYRGTYRGAAVGIEELGRQYPEVNTFRVMLLENHMPQMAITATRAEGQWSLKGDYDYRDISRVLRDKETVNSSDAKLDFTVYPNFTWINHRFDRAFEYVVALAPTMQTSLWPGNRVTLQAIIPIFHDMQRNNSSRYARLGIFDMAQDWTSRNGRWQATMAAGFFYFDRWGLDLRLAYHLTPRLTIGAEASYTGDAYVNDNGYELSGCNKFNFFGKVEYYEPYTRLQGQLTGGRFVFGDYGARLDVSRHFGDYTIGVYGILTGGEHNAGFHFAIPLGPKRQMRRGSVRLMMPEYFDWEYSMVSYFKYYDEQMGKYIETRPDENRSAHYWQPVHVAQYAQKLLNKELK